MAKRLSPNEYRNKLIDELHSKFDADISEAHRIAQTALQARDGVAQARQRSPLAPNGEQARIPSLEHPEGVVELMTESGCEELPGKWNWVIGRICTMVSGPSAEDYQL